MPPEPHVVRKYVSTIVGQCCRRWRQEDREDVIQDALFRFYRGAKSVEFMHWQGYAASVTRSAIFDYNRKWRARVARDVPMCYTRFETADERCSPERLDQARDFEVATQGLSEFDRSVMRHLAEGHKQVEIARSHGVHKSTVYNAQKRLAKRLIAAGAVR